MFSELKSMVPSLTPIVAVIVSFVAVTLTHKQIKLSNKQHLFDKRIENYMIAKGLIQLYRKYCEDINIEKEKDKAMLSIDFDFVLLTNNTYLEQITYAINNVLKEPSHKEFLIKLENLKEVATKIKFLFSGSSSDLLGDFVLRYQELLFEIYRYQMIVNKINKENEIPKLTLEEIEQIVGEKPRRVKLLEAFDNLKKADSALKKSNVEEQIEKQIRLC